MYLAKSDVVLDCNSGTEWSSNATDLFEELSHTAKWKAVMAKVTGYRQTNYGASVATVKLIDTNGPMVCCI